MLALLAAISLSSCGGADEHGDQAAGAPEASTPAPSPSSSPASGDQDTGASDGTPIRITFGDAELTARLDDNATARDLAAQLPLTLTFRDHNNFEKTAPLPRELSLDDAPDGHDPAAGDIGYWAPDGDLVFYYDSDAPFFNGIVRIGEFDGEIDALERQSDDFSATNRTGGMTYRGHRPQTQAPPDHAARQGEGHPDTPDTSEMLSRTLAAI
jgi:hypothetical protein